MAQLINIQRAPGMAELEKDIRIAEITRKIRDTAGIKAAVESMLDEIEIIEQDVIVNGERCVRFYVDGVTAGIEIRQADIDSGELTREDGYRELAEIIQKQG